MSDARAAPIVLTEVVSSSDGREPELQPDRGFPDSGERFFKSQAVVLLNMTEKKRYIRGTCKSCQSTVRVELGDLDTEQIRQALRDRRPYECPGGGVSPHMELGDMLSGYEWSFESFEADAPMSDEEFLKTLRARHDGVLCGVYGKFPEVPNLHDLKDLEHMGFGDFADQQFNYHRIDSPLGTRFYLREERSGP